MSRRVHHHIPHSRPIRRHYAYYEPPQCFCDGLPCICPEDTSGLVRDKVLQPGFYWYDAPPAQGPGFHQWLRDNAALVKVRKSVSAADDNVFGGPNAHTWALFEVIFPAVWLDATKFGFPNSATKDTSPEVASSAELPKNTIDVIADSVKGIIPFLAPVSSGVLVIGGLVGLGYIFRKEIFNVTVKRIRVSRTARSR